MTTKTIKFVPSQCKGGDAAFEGFITLRPVSFEEKYDYLDKLSLKTNDAGEVEMGGTNDKLRYVKTLVGLAKGHFVEVDMKNKKTGEVYKSFDDLSYDGDCHEILMEVGSALIGGFKVGNGSGQA